jgi:large subunit ribosomal protein L24
MGVRIRKGDIVQVISGNSRGKTGRVLAVDEERQRVTVEKINLVKRHTKARRAGAQSGIIEKEAAIHISNVQLYDSKAQRGTRITMRTLPDGKRERVSKASGETLGKS